MKTIASHFEVDRKGLAQLLTRRGIEFAVLELVQNALDADGCTHVHVALKRTARGVCLSVIDNSPNGFIDMTHAYTLFAPSAKKANAEKRGRFNLGEKLVIAAASELEIVSTTGALRFDREGRHRLRKRTEAGTEVHAWLKMTKEEGRACMDALRTVIAPKDITINANIDFGEFGWIGDVASREPLAAVEIVLATEIADDEGYLRPTERKTILEVYERFPHEVAALYELGMPVVETGDVWHINIRQKVPLNVDRDNVKPAYLRKVRAAVANLMRDQLNPETAAQKWVSEALESPGIEPETVRAVIHKRFGEKAVVRDPSDPEANKLAVTKGYVVIEPGSFSAGAWENIRSAEVVKPAGQVTPTPKPFTAGGAPLKTISPTLWSFEEKARVEDIVRLAAELVNAKIHFILADDPGWGFAGAFGGKPSETKGEPRELPDLSPHTLYLNRVHFPDWAEGLLLRNEKLVSFLIHEFAHAKSSDHLSEAYHDALCAIGAKLTRFTHEAVSSLNADSKWLLDA